MKIGIDIRALGTTHLTGIGKYIYHSIDNILKLDKDNQYILFSSGAKKDPYTKLDFNYPNVKHIHIPISNKILNARLIAGLGCKVCDNFLKDIDIFWMPNLNFCTFPQNKKVILTIHDLSFLHSREFYSLKRRYWHKLIDVEKLSEAADHIITVSANTKRDLMRFFSLPEEKISIIYPGVDYIPMDETRASQLTADLNLPDKFFLYVGTLEPRKNIFSIIQAFDRFYLKYPDIHLVIVGSKGWVYSRLLRQIKKRPFVHYLDYVASPLKDALYFKSQGLIWPSFYEGFGFPPMEAIAHQTPVVVSYKTSLPEISKQQAIYIDPYNISDIYYALVNLIEDKNLVAKLKNSAKDFELPKWPDQSQKILDIFNRYK